MSNINIREAVKSDIKTIHNMAHEIWPVTYGEILYCKTIGIHAASYLQ